MAEEALLEAPAEEIVDASLETDAGAAGGEGAGAAGDGGEGGEAGAGEGEAGAGLSGAKLWNTVKAKLETLDPKERAAINRAIHKLDRMERDLPEGTETVRATLEAVKQLAEDPSAPAEKIIADTMAERNYFRAIDDEFTNANPAFVERLATVKPDSFDKLAPVMFSKYAETNPDGFAGYVARTVLQHMDGADVPLHFKVLDTFLAQLPDGAAKDRVIEACRGIFQWSESLRGLAAKQPIAKEAAKGGASGDDLQTREQQLAERETKVTLDGWNAEALQPGIRAVYAEADKVAGKQKLTSDERKKVLAKVGEELDVRLAGNKGYGEAMRGYLAAGNKAKFIQRLESERKNLIPGAVRRAVDDVISERPKPKTAAEKAAAGAAAAKNGAGAAAAAAGSGEKVAWLAGSPTTQNLVVDLNRTTHAMLMKNRAYIKGRETLHAWK